MTPNEIPGAALAYYTRGWRVTPTAGKRPYRRGWQTERLTADETRNVMSRPGCGCGVLLGEPSGWLIDIDLDHPTAVALAPNYLPATGAIFGRAGKPRSHWLYVVTAPVETRKWQHRAGHTSTMLVELRSTGCQTVVPPSVHPSGERVEWDGETIEPATIDPTELVASVERLAEAVETRLGAPRNGHARRNGHPRGGDDIALARSALAGLSAARADSYDDWLRVGMALQSVSDDLLADWDQWSRASGKYRDGECPRKWQSFGGGGVTIATLLGMARDDGWTPPASHVAGAPAWTPAADEPWPEISSFDVLDLPDFPTHVLPDALRRWVEAESHATQTPADLAALLALSVCSVGIARRVVVEPRPGWREPVNLFTAVLLEPGNRKSAVFADAMKPLRELEAELIEAARPEVARAQSDRRQDETLLKKLEKLAGDKSDAGARHDAGNLAARLAEQSEPVLPRLVVDDATAEKLGMMLAEQGGRIASMSPEGGVFDLMAGLYSKSGIPQFGVYLMGHSGDDLITDRVSRKSVRVERPALTCAYAMQPAVIEGLAENAAFRGRGLLARFLYAAPQSWIGRREIATAPVSDATREAYRRTVRALVAAEGETVLRPTPDGETLLRTWETEIEGMLGDGGALEIIRDWGAKLAGATLRLAAVMHCVEHGPAGRIEGPTIAAAIEIARYLIPHAVAVLAMMAASEDSADDDAQYVLRWIVRHDRREFTRSEAQQHGRRRFPKADDIDPALGELARRGYIRPKTAESSVAGRPPSPAYDVNPAVFDFGEAEKRTEYTDNSVDGPKKGNIQNIQGAFRHSEITPRPACAHHDPATWQHRDGSAYCPGCDRWMGRSVRW